MLLITLMVTAAFKMVNTKWSVKEDSYAVKFTTSKFEGVFKGLKSDIQFDEANLAAAKINATIDVATINTGNGMRNKHAKQGLEADKYPTVKFESTSIAKTAAGYIANGKLTIKDVTKDISLPFTFTRTADGGVFAGKFNVVPAEYHVKKMGTPDLFEIDLNIPVTK